ncbi:MAG: hypothetical protein H6867_00540 [Rhodospirillales bacterium]|nr:hypothetical protein [Rhodospirillales bacterium]MCB9996854.1 hypothetical protein [Rhodospirillales bacterium]
MSAKFDSIPKSLKMAFVAAALVGTLSACSSFDLKNQDLLTSTHESGKNVIQQLANLRQGASKNTILAMLGNPSEKDFNNVVGVSRDMRDIKAAYYGDVEIKGTPAEIEAYRQQIQDYEVWTVPFKDIEKKWSMGGTTYNTKKIGNEGHIVLLFDKDGLMVTDAKIKTNPAGGVDKEAILPDIIKKAPIGVFL